MASEWVEGRGATRLEQSRAVEEVNSRVGSVGMVAWPFLAIVVRNMAYQGVMNLTGVHSGLVMESMPGDLRVAMMRLIRDEDNIT